jgi:hypothetical protein
MYELQLLEHEVLHTETTINGEEILLGIEQIISEIRIQDILGLNEKNDLVLVDIIYHLHWNGID